jgi:hypothetical protein
MSIRSSSRPSTPRLLPFAAVAAGVALLAGTTACDAIGGTSSTSATSSPRTGIGSGGGSTAGQSVPRDGSLDADIVIASRPASYEDAMVRIDLISVRRSGSLATLRFTATNTTPGTSDDTDKEWNVDTDLGDKSSDYSVNGVYLIDPAHSKKYPAATDSADDCVCSLTSGVSIVPTQKREFSATFAAPPVDVTSVDVYVPGAGSFENVPVS